MRCQTLAWGGLSQWRRPPRAERVPRLDGAPVLCTPVGGRDETVASRPEAHVAVTAYALDDELILYRDVTGECFALNHTGAYVWSLCDGDRAIDEIADDVSVTYSISRERSVADVRSLVDGLLDAGLLAAE